MNQTLPKKMASGDEIWVFDDNQKKNVRDTERMLHCVFILTK